MLQEPNLFYGERLFLDLIPDFSKFFWNSIVLTLCFIYFEGDTLLFSLKGFYLLLHSIDFVLDLFQFSLSGLVLTCQLC